MSSVPNTNEPYYEFPQLDSHVGKWEAQYYMYDTYGHLYDSKRTIITFARDHNRWYETRENYYRDGTTDVQKFEGNVLKNGELVYDIGRVKGKAWGSDKLLLAELDRIDNGIKIQEIISILNHEKGIKMKSALLSTDDKPEGFVCCVEKRIEESKPIKRNVSSKL